MINLLKKSLTDLTAITAITFLFYSITFVGALAVFNNADFTLIPLFIVFICLLESLLINLLIPSRYLTFRLLVLSFVIFINIFVVNLGFNDDFISLPFKYEFLVMIFFLALFYFMFKIIYESSVVKKYFAPFVLAFSLLNIFYNYFAFHETKIAQFNYANEKMPESDRSQLRSYPEYLSNIKYDVKLNDKPNIIIIAFDALVDHKTYQLLTKRNGTPFMWRVFDERLKSHKNHFSDEISTRHSLSTLLSLTPELTYTLPFDHSVSIDLAPRFRLYNGQTPSPLYEIFRSNGYEVSSFFVDKHSFGTFKGDYIDNFFTLPVRFGYESSVCNLIGHRTQYIGFFGYCEALNKIKNSMSAFMAYTLSTEENVHWETSIGKMEFDHYYFHITQPYDLIKTLDNKTKPQLLFGHVIAPMHIGPLYSPNFKNKSDGSFREFVINYEKLSDYVGALVEKIADHLEDKQSNTIVYIMGDHGMMLSQRMTWSQETFVDEKFRWDQNNNLLYGKGESKWQDIKDNEVQLEQEYIIHQDDRDDTPTAITLGPSLGNENIVVRDAEPYRRLDRYSTYGGFISDHKCAIKSLENNKSRGYSTPQLVAHDLITCLSDYVVTDSNKEYIRDFKREKTLFSQAYPVCISSHSPCSKECIEIEGNCFAEGSDPVSYIDLLYE